jgi:CHASE2 domain-containing sensor protein
MAKAGKHEAVDRVEHSEHGRKNKWRVLALEVVVAIVVCGSLARIAHWFNGTRVGEETSFWTYRILQGRLHPLSPPPVLVLDISNLHKESIGGPTPRDKLLDILYAVAKYHPAAIGVDIDFSPEQVEDSQTGKKRWRYVEPSDPVFFDALCQADKGVSAPNPRPANHCEQNERMNHVPVFLGVSRTQYQDPRYWLLDEKYQSLAASLLLPRNGERTFRYLASEDAPQEEKNEARTLSAALADAYLHENDTPIDHPLISHPLASLRENVFERFPKIELPLGQDSKERLSLEQAFVDYSVLNDSKLVKSFSPGTFTGTDEDQESKINREIDRIGRALTNKVILIGDSSEAEDQFPNGMDRDVIGGVLIHASAVYTAIAAPLYSMPESWQGWFDFGLGMFIVLISILIPCAIHEVPIIRKVLPTWSITHPGHKRLFPLIVVLTILFVLFMAVEVNRTRILWDDFILVALGLALHPMTERYAERGIDFLREKLDELRHSVEAVKKGEGD